MKQPAITAVFILCVLGVCISDRTDSSDIGVLARTAALNGAYAVPLSLSAQIVGSAVEAVTSLRLFGGDANTVCRDSARITALLAASKKSRSRNLFRAVAEAREALQLAQQCGSIRFRAAAYASLGWAQIDRVHIDSVETLFRGADSLARIVDDSTTLASALSGQASLSVIRGPGMRAMQLLQQAEAIAGRHHDTITLAEVLNIRSQLECARGLNQTALELRERALALFRDVGDSTGILRMLIGIAATELSIGLRLDDSLCVLVIDRAGARGDSCILGHAYRIRGQILGAQGQRERAAEHFERGALIAHSIGSIGLAVRAAVYLGMNRSRSNLPEEAKIHLERALPICISLGHPDLLNAAYWGFALTAEAEGDHMASLEYHQRRSAVLRNAKDSIGLAGAYIEIADLLEARQRFDSARSMMREAVICIRNSGSREFLLSFLLAAGEMDLRFGLLQNALAKFRESEELLVVEDPAACDHGSLRFLIAETYINMERFEDAIDHYQRAINAFVMRKDLLTELRCKRALASALFLRGSSRQRRCDFDSALTLLDEVIVKIPVVRNQRLYAAAQLLRGRIYTAIGRYDDALPILHSALASVRSQKSDRDEPPILHAIGVAHFQAGRQVRALDTLRMALEAMRGFGYPGKLRDILRDMCAFSVTRHDYRAAYEYFREGAALNDSLANAEHQYLIADLDARYSTAMKQQEIALLEQERRVNVLTLAQQREEILRHQSEARENRQRLDALAQKNKLDRLKLERQGDALRIQRLVNDRQHQENAMLHQREALQRSRLDNRTLSLQLLATGLALVLITFFMIYRRIKGRRREALLRANAAELHAEAAQMQARAAALQAQVAEAEAHRLAAETERREKELQREMTRGLFETQEAERKRIAGDLHDSLGQELVVIRNRAMLAAEQSGEPDVLRSQLDRIIEMTGRAMSTVREITHNLRPTELDRLGLTAALRSIVHASQDTNGVRLEMEIAAIDHLFTSEQEILIYRIVQEAVGNILRHAHAKEAAVRIGQDNGELSISIRDDGRGFTLQSTTERVAGVRHGLGLRSMQERTEMLGGRFILRSAEGQGTSLHITIPLVHETAPVLSGAAT